MTEKEKAYYELGKLYMAQKIMMATKNSKIMNAKNFIYLEGVRDAWNVVYDAINAETELMLRILMSGAILTARSSIFTTLGPKFRKLSKKDLRKILRLNSIS